jgi:hypothetical protein
MTIAFGLPLAASLSAQSTPRLNDTQIAVMRADEIYRLAKLNRDVGTLDRILAEGFNETNQNGNSRNKSQTLELWKSFGISSLTTDSFEVRIAGDTAMVTGAQTESGWERMLFTRVYVRSGTGWQLLASMQFRDPKLEAAH